MFRASRAFTLIETVVASALLTVFLTIVVVSLLKVSGFVQRTALISELQQSAQITLTRVDGMARRCDGGGCSFVQRSDLVALSLHPIFDVNVEARKLYEERVTVFAWDQLGKRLLEFRSDRFPLEERYQPHKLGEDAIEALVQGSPSRVLCKYVDAMSLESSDQNFPLLLKLTLRANAPGYGQQSVLIERHLAPRVHY